jgi:hypothetical protein
VISAGHLIAMITSQHPLLMAWSSQLYVVDGVTYVETFDYDTRTDYKAIHKILLQDVRFSDARRAVSFDRLKDDLTKVQGFLSLQAAPQ